MAINWKIYRAVKNQFSLEKVLVRDFLNLRNAKDSKQFKERGEFGPKTFALLAGLFGQLQAAFGFGLAMWRGGR